MDYTVCSKVVNYASEDYKYAFDLLMQFTYENPHRVIINDEILDEYLKLAENNYVIKSWITGMDYKKYWKKLTPKDKENIFIDTCKFSSDKKIIVNEKEDYSESDYLGLDVFNKDEAIEHLKPTKKVKNKIIQKGKKNQMSNGNNSPNSK
ncbi:hypothetical protein [Winogradskyella ludwigii]|uniref:hypothetical protein n=1 Tax=Winogradskyella ludwigii TaxID=2686076 RepID=UPI0015CA4527|nr:hypothetical protein [Winogradskyella ludwigii]